MTPTPEAVAEVMELRKELERLRDAAACDSRRVIVETREGAEGGVEVVMVTPDEHDEHGNVVEHVERIGGRG